MEAGIPGWLTGTAQGDQGVRDTNEPSLAFLCPFLGLVTSTPSPPHPPPRPPRLEAPPPPLSPKLGGGWCAPHLFEQVPGSPGWLWSPLRWRHPKEAASFLCNDNVKRKQY